MRRDPRAVIAALAATTTVALAQPVEVEVEVEVAPPVVEPEPPPPPPPPPPPLDAAALEALIDARVDARLATRDRVTWRDGFGLESADGAWKLRLGGYTHFDARFFVDDDGAPQPDQFTFRRIRPELAGTLFDRAEFRLLTDFAGGRAVVQDAYVELIVADALRVRVGKFKEPFGLERLQSATALTFVERGLPTALAPNRDLGVQLAGALARGRVAYQLGVWNGVADGGSGDGDVADDKELVARLFVTPFAPDRGHALEALGVGVAASYGTKLGTAAATELPTLRTSGQAAFFTYRTGTTAADTAIADGDHWRVTAHGHVYLGRVGVLAELVHTNQDVALGAARTEVASDAWQLAVNAVVLGGRAGWKGTAPTAGFAPGKGRWGAVELAARYHGLRVDAHAFAFAADPARAARRADAVSLGVNWTLSKALRFVLDGERTTFEGGAAAGADRATELVVLGRAQTVF